MPRVRTFPDCCTKVGSSLYEISLSNVSHPDLELITNKAALLEYTLLEPFLKNILP
jgi:hypothetical protein